MNDPQKAPFGTTRLRGYEPPPLEAATRLSYYPWLVIGLTCLSGFIGQLDASVVQLALPALEREFNAGLSAVSWVAIAYSLAFASSLPAFARLSEIFGRKLIYLGGYAGFTLASALCGVVSDLRLLIALRLIQGMGGALLGANSITIPFTYNIVALTSGPTISVQLTGKAWRAAISSRRASVARGRMPGTWSARAISDPTSPVAYGGQPPARPRPTRRS